MNFATICKGLRYYFFRRPAASLREISPLYVNNIPTAHFVTSNPIHPAMAYPKIFQFNLKQFAQVGLEHAETVHYQSNPEELRAQAINYSKVQVQFTRLAQDKYNAFSPKLFNELVVEADQTQNRAIQNNEYTTSDTPHFSKLYQQFIQHFNEVPQLWVQDFFANSNHTITIRLVTDNPWCAFFVSHLFHQPEATMLPLAAPDVQLWAATQLPITAASAAPAMQTTGMIGLKEKCILLSGPCNPVHLQRLVAIALGQNLHL